MNHTMNPIAAHRAQPSTSATAGLTSQSSEKSAQGANGFINYMLMQLGAMNIPSDQMDAITQDMNKASKDGASPVLGLLKSIAGQASLEAEADAGLSAPNEMVLRELASLFAAMDTNGNLNLTDDTRGQLHAIVNGDVPASDLLPLINDSGVMNALTAAMESNTPSKDMTDMDDVVAGLAAFLERLNDIQLRVQDRITALDSNKTSKESMQKLEAHITQLIKNVQQKIDLAQQGKPLNGDGASFDMDLDIMEGDIKALRGDSAARLNELSVKTDAAKSSTDGLKAMAPTLNTGDTVKANNTKSFTLSADGLTFDGLNTAGDDALSSDGRLNGALKTSAHSASQSAPAMRGALLPPSPAAQQVLVHIQRNAANTSNMTIKLSPAELGRVDIRLSMDKDGTTKATIVADRVETLSLLQKDAGHLERALQSAGLQANAQDLNFQLRGQNDQAGNSKLSNKSNRDSLDAIDDGMDIASHELEPAIFGQYSVDYKA